MNRYQFISELFNCSSSIAKKGQIRGQIDGYLLGYLLTNVKHRQEHHPKKTWRRAWLLSTIFGLVGTGQAGADGTDSTGPGNH